MYPQINPRTEHNSANGALGRSHRDSHTLSVEGVELESNILLSRPSKSSERSRTTTYTRQSRRLFLVSSNDLVAGPGALAPAQFPAPLENSGAVKSSTAGHLALSWRTHPPAPLGRALAATREPPSPISAPLGPSLPAPHTRPARAGRPTPLGSLAPSSRPLSHRARPVPGPGGGRPAPLGTLALGGRGPPAGPPVPLSRRIPRVPGLGEPPSRVSAGQESLSPSSRPTRARAAAQP
jgi:hypothetical protein